MGRCEWSSRGSVQFTLLTWVQILWGYGWEGEDSDCSSRFFFFPSSFLSFFRRVSINRMKGGESLGYSLQRTISAPITDEEQKRKIAVALGLLACCVYHTSPTNAICSRNVQGKSVAPTGLDLQQGYDRSETHARSVLSLTTRETGGRPTSFV